MVVKEDSGIISLLVERAQGLIGNIDVEWKTDDGTAKSSGVQDPDYVVSDADHILSIGSCAIF